jgi:hypothetical protein
MNNFNTLLTGSSWDLVIMDMPSNVPLDGFADLIAYIGSGGAAILSYWDLDGNAIAGGAALAAAFEVTVASSFDTPLDVFAWDSTHAIFNSPNSVSTLTSWTNQWGDDGDRFSLTGAALLVGGFTAAPAAGQGAIGIGNGGRTIVNGFLFDEINDLNGIRLIENEISFLVAQEVPEPATLMLLGAGMSAIAVRRRLRRRS